MDMRTLNYFEALNCGGSGILDVKECNSIDDVRTYIDICNDKIIKEGYRDKPINYGIYLVTRIRVFDNDGLIANETTTKTRVEIYPNK